MRNLAPFAPLLALAASLTACGDPAPREAAQNSAAPVESGYIAKVKALPAPLLSGVLFRAIRGGGGPNCQGLDSVEAMPAQNNRPVWRATCSDRNQYLVTLSDDGTAIVTSLRPGG